MSWTNTPGQALRAKPCAYCTKPFTPLRPLQAVCGPVCARKKVLADKAKGARELRARKEAIKKPHKWMAECQVIVNKIVRLSALARGEGCFTCGATPAQKFGGTYDAGHFRSVGSAPHLRYWMPQIKLQCIPCNRHKGGMALLFRQRLVREHGQAWVEALEARQEIAKFDIPYLVRFKKVMGRKLKRLEKRCNAA